MSIICLLCLKIESKIIVESVGIRTGLLGFASSWQCFSLPTGTVSILLELRLPN